jgi:hypothetical protein
MAGKEHAPSARRRLARISHVLAGEAQESPVLPRRAPPRVPGWVITLPKRNAGRTREDKPQPEVRENCGLGPPGKLGTGAKRR